MQFVSAAQIDALLDFPALIDALARAFAGELTAPARHHHSIGAAGPAQPVQLLMSAWSTHAPASGSFLGTKIVNFFPANGTVGLPTVLGQYVLQSGETGAPLAVMDGTRLTHWRTAAASALAARTLARADAAHLLMVGCGALAPCLIAAHCAIRPISRISLWNHNPARAAALAARLAAQGMAAEVVDNLAAAAPSADIISCATASREPLVMGRWLKPGTHLDLVGAFSLTMRECDNEAVRRSSVYIDTPAALSEGGDVALAILEGALAATDVRGDLAGLCMGRVGGRQHANEITLFKSVGASIEDLAAARLVWERLQA